MPRVQRRDRTTDASAALSSFGCKTIAGALDAGKGTDAGNRVAPATRKSLAGDRFVRFCQLIRGGQYGIFVARIRLARPMGAVVCRGEAGGICDVMDL